MIYKFAFALAACCLLSSGAMAGDIKFKINDAVLQKLKNLKIEKSNCRMSNAVDVESLRQQSLVDLVDLELQHRLKKSDEKLDGKVKVMARLSLHEMCSQQKYTGGKSIEKKEIATSLNNYKQALLSRSFNDGEIILPKTSAKVEVERDGLGNATGWVRARYPVTSKSLGLVDVENINLEVIVRKNIFDIMDMSCYKEISMESRALIFDGIVKADGHKELLSLAERKSVQEQGYSFLVGTCQASGGGK